ncbi:L-aspartate oxidase [Halorubrum tebenquichense]|uniref:L-aspartate oxidase n=1 Tax=Halorubrum tebenquichense DSM 14210 TaxID=1227485 RepID=M0DXK1_9EURY|nr:FAD-dependent oxidoreductase [Halorubrum tebenquichense]ELZ40236.1 L-aspartate oxidase [Halorubrum tebenquichense DSM 14210]
MTGHETADVLVVGSGIAGLAAALAAAREGNDVVVATKATRPEDASSWWAQGGIAVARDHPDRFRRDILAASDGTADPEAVEVLVENANDAVRDVLVETLDVTFDGGADGSVGTDAAAGANPPETAAEFADRDGGFDFGREAAHTEDRILHVGAETGKHVHVPLLNHLDNRADAELRTDTAALELIGHEGRIHGAVVESEGDRTPVYAGATVLATGGVGDLFARSTNPAGATGDGIAMAALAGATVTDAEFVQFHPTAYAAGPDEDGFLVSEAVRGEGALLRNGDGERFMPDYHPDAELAPRDVVARAVDREREATGSVVLDVEPLDFADEFPGLAGKCEDRGVDWTRGIPVAPAEHFLCGGVAVDDRGRTSLDRLYAVGECARTGVHGANRLASTSLLEGLVWGLRAGADAADAAAGDADPEAVETPALLDRDPALPDDFARQKFRRLRRVMDDCVGIERDADDLNRALGVLRRLKGEVDAYVRTRTSRSLYELRNATVTALLVTRQALANERSVGTHYRTDAAEPAEPGPADD